MNHMISLIEIGPQFKISTLLEYTPYPKVGKKLVSTPGASLNYYSGHNL